MRWERFFEDLEIQVSSERERERAELDTEARRVQLARTPLSSRVACLRGVAMSVRCVGAASTTLSGTLCAAGTDWLALSPRPDAAAVVPLDAVESIVLGEQDLIASALRSGPSSPATGAERVTLGFVLRDLARRRVGVVVYTRSGRSLSGTIDRAAADHFDLAAHDAGQPRRDCDVRSFHVIAYSAIGWMLLDRDPLSR